MHETLKHVVRLKIEEELVKGVERAKQILEQALACSNRILSSLDDFYFSAGERAMDMNDADVAGRKVNFANDRFITTKRKLETAMNEFNKGGGLRAIINDVEVISCGIILGYWNQKKNKAWAVNFLRYRYNPEDRPLLYEESHPGSIKILKLNRNGEFVLALDSNEYKISVYNSEGTQIFWTYPGKKFENETIDKVLGAAESYDIKLLEQICLEHGPSAFPDYDYHWREEAERKKIKQSE